jgi:hypothetical protein
MLEEGEKEVETFIMAYGNTCIVTATTEWPKHYIL